MRWYLPAVERLRRYSWIVFIFFAVLATFFGVFGPWADGGDSDIDANWLITTYAALAVVLTVAIALTAYRRGERWAWLAFWAWPAFFIIHGILFFAVDYLFALIGIAALLAAQPREGRPA